MYFLPLASAIALLPAMQAGSESATSIYAAEPTTWTLEYDILMEPFVDVYYNCLKSGMRTIVVDPRFEVQHRSDIPRCAEVEAEASAEANAIYAERAVPGEPTPVDVARLFEAIRTIHIARGRDLDDHIRLRAEARETYWAEHRDTERRRVVTEIELDTAPTYDRADVDETQSIEMPEAEGTNATN